MPDLPPLISAVGIALLAVVLLWFAIGTQVNVRRGNRVLAWLQDGLPAIGPRATLRWLGSSVAALKIVDPVAPFNEAEILVVLEPRDLGGLWALARARGRRDFLILRFGLIHRPTYRADLIDPGSWTARDRRGAEEPTGRVTMLSGAGGHVIEVHEDGDAPVEELRRDWNALGATGGNVWRLSVRPTVPHLEIHLRAPDLERAGSARLVAEVRQVAERVGRERVDRQA
jgi:hypothetical protein